LNIVKIVEGGIQLNRILSTYSVPTEHTIYRFSVLNPPTSVPAEHRICRTDFDFEWRSVGALPAIIFIDNISLCPLSLMAKILMKLLIITLLFFTTASAQIKTSKAGKARLAEHKTVALLPVDVVFHHYDNLSKDAYTQRMNDLKLYASITLQNYIFNYLHTHSAGKSKVQVQHIDVTDSILHAKGLTFSKVFEGNKTELCRLLGVDAILYPRFTFKEPLTKGGRVLYTTVQLVLAPVYPGAKQSLAMQVQVFDKNNTEPAWQFRAATSYFFSAVEKLLESQEKRNYRDLDVLYYLLNDLLKPFDKKFPYPKSG
jgi:hypothetical protein